MRVHELIRNYEEKQKKSDEMRIQKSKERKRKKCRHELVDLFIIVFVVEWTDDFKVLIGTVQILFYLKNITVMIYYFRRESFYIIYIGTVYL